MTAFVNSFDPFQMSWLFGIKTQPPAPPPDETRLNTGQNDRQRSSAAQSSPDGSKFNYSFDSTALERAATAAKELEKSPNAKQMLELSRQQEITKQRKADENIKVSLRHIPLSITPRLAS